MKYKTRPIVKWLGFEFVKSVKKFGLHVNFYGWIMSTLFTSTGRYHYYNSWLMVDCCEELARYYRSLVHSFSPSIFLQVPKHDSHITVIAGKYEPNHDQRYWKRYDGQEINFSYSPIIGSDGTYFWLPVFCPDFEKVRMELGLNPLIPIPWHLTIGNLK